MNEATDVSRLEEQLAPLRAALEADGAGLRVSQVDPPGLLLEIAIGPETCADCILPDHMLEQAVLTQLDGGAPYGIETVRFRRIGGPVS